MGTLYVTPAQLTTYGVNPFALQKVSQDEQTAACVACSAKADDYMNSRYKLPLLSWPPSITMAVAHMAIWVVLSNRGRNPEAGYDDEISMRYREAIAYFEGIQQQRINPAGIVDSGTSNPPSFPFPKVTTGPTRGWTRAGRW